MSVVVGVTGHTNISDTTVDLVHREIVELLQSLGDTFIGMTCLARGADQAFADAVLDVGGQLRVVVPAADYFQSIRDPAAAERCQYFLAASESTVMMEHVTSGPAAYLAASRYLIDQCDLLVAVWDGSAPTGTGGTADAVDYAHRQSRETAVVWPAGAERR